MAPRFEANRTPRERLAVIEQIVCDMHQQLLGNGQPGELEKLRRRVSRNEKRWAVLVGIVSAISGGLMWVYYAVGIAAKATELTHR